MKIGKILLILTFLLIFLFTVYPGVLYITNQDILLDMFFENSLINGIWIIIMFVSTGLFIIVLCNFPYYRAFNHLYKSSKLQKFLNFDFNHNQQTSTKTKQDIKSEFDIHIK